MKWIPTGSQISPTVITLNNNQDISILRVDFGQWRLLTVTQFSESRETDADETEPHLRQDPQ